ncbi:KTSC domain containing protein [Bradyrhizobium sp. CCBAU 11357]|nr:KTSC domain-containing protein [Bradyrhizobium sp. CCBAU 11357]MDA9499550.1 KTSC domain containing protein [Bradyrhizobium sp. CCBAU 11357]
MERQAVASSHIASIGYSPGSEILEVEFRNGTIYEYYNVPEVIYEQLMNASSIGQFFNANIRNAFANQRA